MIGRNTNFCVTIADCLGLLDYFEVEALKGQASCILYIIELALKIYKFGFYISRFTLTIS